MIIFAIGIVSVVMGILAILIANTKLENKKKAFVLAAVGMALIMAGMFLAIDDRASGAPKGILTGNEMPPEDLPLIINMENKKNGFLYMTAVPYNNDSNPRYYRVSMADTLDPANITAGSIVINDNGIIKPFPITLKV